MGVTYGNGTQFVISLQGNEAVQLNFTNVDPTGLHLLTSDGAVFGVLSGAIETAVNGSLPGNLYDVIPPHQLIGNFYVGVPLPGKDELIWRLVSTGVSNTVMFVLGQGGPGDLWVTLSQGEHADYVTNASNAVLIYSPKPAVVSLVTPSG
ncbi:uncharacterized protein [Littorina saxatilis]|uniref:uncharacterized protein n=1 Tax=Littorina saxatilis TaxID=31220 RepID=UPI0038B43D36